MKKHIIAVAVAAAFAAPVAMADTTLYGLANLSLDYIDAGNFEETASSITGGKNFNVASGSSRIGIKGSEKISNDLSAIYQAEFGVDMVDGNGLTARNQYAGLSSKSFGTIIAGRHDTPMKLATSKYDLFSDQIGDNGNIVGGTAMTYGTTAGFNLRTANTVAYMTPNLAGFSATLAYVADHQQNLSAYNGGLSTATNDDRNKNDAFSASAGYEYKKLFNVTAAYEVHYSKYNPTNTSITPGLRDKEDAWLLGAGVNLAGFKVNGLYQQIKSFEATNNKTNVYGLGAAYTFGKKHTVKGQWYQANSDLVKDANGEKAKRNLFAVGYDFAISKQTTLFAAYAYGDAGQVTWGDGHGGKTEVIADNNQDTNAFSVGMKYKF